MTEQKATKARKARPWGRVATAAHPLCSCREHDHERDYCPGTDVYYRTKDGTEVPGRCLILAGIEWSTRESCPMHGKAGPSTPDGGGTQGDFVANDPLPPSGQTEPSVPVDNPGERIDP